MSRNRLVWLFLPACAVASSAGAAPIVVIDPADPARKASCADLVGRAWRECIYRETLASKWSIQITEGPGPPGTSTFYVPNAMKVLQRIVDRCKVGETFYVRESDGMASLYLPELTPRQVSCIRKRERPGVRLE